MSKSKSWLGSGPRAGDQGRAYGLHAVTGGDGGHILRAGGDGIAEELLHQPSWRVGDEHTSGAGTDGDEGVGDVARAHDGVSGFERDALVAGLDEDLAFYDVEPFLLRGVEWSGGPQPGMSLVCSMAKRVGVSAVEVLKWISL